MEPIIESFIGSFLGMAAGSLLLMLFGMFFIKYLVRVIMNEIFKIAAERVNNKGKDSKEDSFFKRTADNLVNKR